MPESVVTFISELIRAANEVERLTNTERANLLQRAAATVLDLREQVGVQRSVADAGDIVQVLGSIADTIDLHGPQDISTIILDAAAAIRDGRANLERLLDAEYEQLIDELNKATGAT